MSSYLTVLPLLLLITGSLAKGKTSTAKAKVAQKLKKSMPHHKAAQRKGSMVFEETSKEKIKSTLDKSFGLLGSWNQNSAEILPGCLGPNERLRYQQGLLNQPINPIMHINGYPINPKGSKSLAQTMDGNLEEEDDLHEVIRQIGGRKSGFRGNRMRGMGDWRPLKPINYPMHRTSHGVTSGRMLGSIDVNDGYRREKAVYPKIKQDIFKNIHGLILRKMYEKRLAKLRSRRIRLLMLQAKRIRLLKLLRNVEQAEKLKLINC